MATTVHIDLRGLNKVRRSLLVGSSHMRQIEKDWKRIYNKFTATRFRKFSSGGGNWPPLSAAYAARKTLGRILVNEGTLENALETDTGFSGASTKPLQVVAGFTSSMGSHPAGMSIKSLAEIHQLGLGRVPQREIIVEPDRPTVKKMEKAAAKGIRKLIRDSNV